MATPRIVTLSVLRPAIERGKSIGTCLCCSPAVRKVLTTSCDERLAAVVHMKTGLATKYVISGVLGDAPMLDDTYVYMLVMIQCSRYSFLYSKWCRPPKQEKGNMYAVMTLPYVSHRNRT